MSTYNVKYSDLVSDDNRCPLLTAIQKPQMFKTVIRARALNRHKLLYNTMVDAETKINLLIDKDTGRLISSNIDWGLAKTHLVHAKSNKMFKRPQ